jgi:hypothetical protein
LSQIRRKEAEKVVQGMEEEEAGGGILEEMKEARKEKSAMQGDGGGHTRFFIEKHTLFGKESGGWTRRDDR